jgi:hypothetical protein
MSALPGYLGALARAGDWSLPEDDATVDATDSARPRPHSRFEPDGIGGDGEWGEVAEEREVAAPPGVVADAPARPVSPTAPPPPAAEVPADAMLANAHEADSNESAAARPPEPAVIEPPAAVPAEPSAGGVPAAAEPRAGYAPLRVGVVADRRDPAEARPAPDPAPFATAATESSDRPADAEPPPVPAVPEVITERVIHEARPAPTAPIAPAEEVSAEPAHHGVTDDGPTIVVEIGRIEVRLAPDSAPAPRPAVRPTVPGPSLADYLRQRDATGVRPA